MDLSEVIDQRLVADPAVGGDVTEEALRRGWVLPFAEGQYVYGAEWTSLVRRLQELLLARASGMGFREYLFPRLIPSEAVRDFQLSQFKPRLLWNLDDHNKILDPVQCLPFYHVLRGRRFRADELPLKIVETLGGWTWRREQADELDGIFRSVEFARVEHVWLGTPDQARDIRNELCESIVDLLTELGLSVQTVVGEPCMPLKTIEDRRRAATSPDDVPVIDIELHVRLPRSPDAITPRASRSPTAGQIPSTRRAIGRSGSAARSWPSTSIVDRRPWHWPGRSITTESADHRPPLRRRARRFAHGGRTAFGQGDAALDLRGSRVTREHRPIVGIDLDDTCADRLGSIEAMLREEGVKIPSQRPSSWDLPDWGVEFPGRRCIRHGFLDDLRRAGRQVIAYDLPYNRSLPGRRTRTWSEVRRHLESVIKLDEPHLLVAQPVPATDAALVPHLAALVDLEVWAVTRTYDDDRAAVDRVTPGFPVRIFPDQAMRRGFPTRHSNEARSLLRQRAAGDRSVDVVHVEGHYLFHLVPERLAPRTVIVEHNVESHPASPAGHACRSPARPGRGPEDGESGRNTRLDPCRASSGPVRRGSSTH